MPMCVLYRIWLNMVIHYHVWYMLIYMVMYNHLRCKIRSFMSIYDHISPMEIKYTICDIYKFWRKYILYILIYIVHIYFFHVGWPNIWLWLVILYSVCSYLLSYEMSIYVLYIVVYVLYMIRYIFYIYESEHIWTFFPGASLGRENLDSSNNRWTTQAVPVYMPW